MNKLITKVLAITFLLVISAVSFAQSPALVWDKSEITTAWANAAAASVLKAGSGIEISQIGTAGIVNGYLDLNNSNGNLVLNATGNDAVTISAANANITMIKMTYSANNASVVANPYVGYHTESTAMGSAAATVSSCEINAAGVTGTTGQQITYTPPAGTKFAIIVRGKACGEIASNGNTARIYRIEVYTAPSSPSVVLSSGNNPASAMETIAMNPVVYTYTNVADDANVLADWYSDNTYTATTTAPAGLAIAKNTTAKTVTVSGTPTTAGTYYYKVSVNETEGNAIQGVVNVSAYVTPAPQFTLTSGNNNQYPVKETAISNIVYTLANATGATSTGLPAGLAGVYDAGVYTISGTLAAEAAPGVYNYTVTAAALAGYEGADITATGKIVVKSATALQICYLVASTTPSANDTRLYPTLMDNPNYIVTLRTAAATAPAASVYDAYDLIILNEIVGGTNAEALALKNVDKPILSLKAYTYTSGRWSWGVPDNGLAANGNVTVVQPSHPIFNGVTINNDMVELMSNASGNAAQVVDVTLLQGRSIVVATAPKTNNAGVGVSIHDVPASVRGVVNSKFLLIGVADVNYAKLSDDLLAMIDNGISYLTSGVQFDAPSLNISSIKVDAYNGVIDQDEATIRINLPIGSDLTEILPEITLAGAGTTVTPSIAQNFSNSLATPLIYTVSDRISTKSYSVTIVDDLTSIHELNVSTFEIIGNRLNNPLKEFISIFDATGRLVISAHEDIQLDNLQHGIYIIRSQSSVMKIAITR